MEVFRNLLGWRETLGGQGERGQEWGGKASDHSAHVMSVMREEEGKQAREESDTSALWARPSPPGGEGGGWGKSPRCLTAVGARRSAAVGPLSVGASALLEPAGRTVGGAPSSRFSQGAPPNGRCASVGRRVEGLPVGSLYSPLSARGAGNQRRELSLS